MKDKMLYLIIGILIGAIITGGVFMLISRNNDNQRGQMPDFTNFDANNLPEGFDPSNRQNGRPDGTQANVTGEQGSNII